MTPAPIQLPILADGSATDDSVASTDVLHSQRYWRSLNDLAQTPAFREFVEKEFPSQAQRLEVDGLDRRRFLQLMAASFGLAGLAGCRRPELEILPYSTMPEHVVPGLPTFYATTMPRPGGGFPILVETHTGRPTKIEGNPEHPVSLGKTDLQAQAAILDLYDPDRSQTVMKGGFPTTWSDWDSFAEVHFGTLRKANGKGLAILTESLLSPTMRRLRDHALKVAPETRWFSSNPSEDGNVSAGLKLLFDQPLRPRNQIEQADVLLVLDADPLGTDDDSVQAIRAFAARRSTDDQPAGMNRLYVVEPSYTVTGGVADHRLRMPAAEVARYVLELALELKAESALGVLAKGFRNIASEMVAKSFAPGWITEVAADLKRAGPRALVIAGTRQPPLVHALVWLINQSLGSVGTTVDLIETPIDPSSQLTDLTAAIDAGEIKSLVILGGNPVYDAPADLDFASRLKKVPTAIHLGVYADETTASCRWHLPEAHFLESWGDTDTLDGGYAIVQPMIAPLFGGRSGLQLLAEIFQVEPTEPNELVKETFKLEAASVAADSTFAEFLHTGFLAGKKVAAATPEFDAIAAGRKLQQQLTGFAEKVSANGQIEITFQRASGIRDGRFANNGWLQELPDPVTKLTWGNAALLSGVTAGKLGITTGDVIEMTHSGRTIKSPVFVQPGQADDSIALTIGYGRTKAGRVGDGVGINVYPLRTTESLGFATDVTVKKVSGQHAFASTQDHWSLEGRDLIHELIWREATTATADSKMSEKHLEDDFQSRDDDSNSQNGHSEKSRDEGQHIVAAKHGQATGHGYDGHGRPVQIVTPPPLDGEHQWGMVIDLNACVGCTACMVACQSENNVPIVGADEVSRGRSMHWLRVDRYFNGSPEDPSLVHQPVACVHCEDAPCEIVCPVNATVHSPEGLNLQVYNRCIGTRYCSNNCPYKVRRFNWFDYQQRPLDELRLGPLAEYGMDETLKMHQNPDVSVRMRGVMEKCTYCVQRVERAKIGAKLKSAANGTPYTLPDGSVVPACAQACPADAIVFGDTADPTSRVSKLKEHERNYALLGELGTRPRTSYLARVRNPNPKMPTTEARKGEHS